MYPALIDLHTHTTASDGTDTPRELVLKAARQGIKVLAITDHDTTAGWSAAMEAAREVGIKIVPGAEFSTSATGITAHLLGYFFDPQDQTIQSLFHQVKVQRRKRLQAIVEKVAVDYPLSWEEVEAQAQGEVAIGRPHLADALIKRGYFSDRNAVFAEVLHTASPYYVRYQAPDPSHVCRAICAAGGVAVLAHPRAGKRQRRFLGADTIAELKAAGLWGLEVYHPEQSPREQAKVAALAEKFELAKTGASDYHGRGKTNRLGQCVTAAETFWALLKAAGAA